MMEQATWMEVQSRCLGGETNGEGPAEAVDTAETDPFDSESPASRPCDCCLFPVVIVRADGARSLYLNREQR